MTEIDGFCKVKDKDMWNANVKKSEQEGTITYVPYIDLQID